MKDFLNSIRTSKHFDVIAKVLLTACMIGGLHIAYTALTIMGGFFPATVLEALLAGCTAGVLFFMGTLVIDLYLFVSERVYYVFLKRNGDRSFDYQESFKKLSEWQQVLLSTLKPLFLLLLYVLILSR
jgi:hypothetical protein